MTPEERKQQILDTADDAARDFIYYDRKDGAELAEGAIQKAVADGVITYDEIVAMFRERLLDWA